MIIYNGLLKDNTRLISIQNRGLKFGDSLFESLRVINQNIKFWEDHYFRLMAGMRIMRMKIPMSFTMEFFQSQITELLNKKNITDARIRLTITRKNGGLYTPENNKVDFFIEATELHQKEYILNTKPYEIDLFKDFKKNKSLLSTIKSNNKLEHIIAGIYAKENHLDNVLLLNSDNRLAEAVNANIFIVKGNEIVTPSSTEGCVKGIIRKKLLEIINRNPAYDIIEREVNHFEMMKADEVFLTNISFGIQPVSKFRKKLYTQTNVAEMLIKSLNSTF
ncbi:MAG: aminotransferase class IV [Flavobacteriales bacterium]